MKTFLKSYIVANDLNNFIIWLFKSEIKSYLQKMSLVISFCL